MTVFERVAKKLLQLDPDGSMHWEMDNAGITVAIQGALKLHPHPRKVYTTGSLEEAFERLEALTLDPLLAEVRRG